MGIAIGLPTIPAFVIGLSLSLSSTALVLQTLAEKKQLTAHHGRAAFAILLFQDLAAIPLLGLFALLGGEAQDMDWIGMTKTLAVVAVVVVAGRYLLRPYLRFPHRRPDRPARDVHRRRPAHRAGRRAADGRCRPVRRAGHLRRRRRARQQRVPPRAGQRRRAVQGPAARPVLHGRRHVGRSCTGHSPAASDHRTHTGADGKQGAGPLRAGAADQAQPQLGAESGDLRIAGR
jgi:hypothetical protein